MSRYTTQVRYICEHYAGLENSVGYDSINNVISKSIDKIFEPDIPFFDDKYKNVLYTKILRHYYDREIGFETVGLWKLKLNNKLHELMPYYNKLYEVEQLKIEPLFNVSIEKTSKTTFNGKKTTIGNDKNITNATITNTHLDMFSDTPQGYIDNLDNSGYITEANKATDTSTNDGTVELNRSNTDTTNNTDDYIEKLTGYTGVSASDMLVKYRDALINIDLMIIKELQDLFFLLWR